ncbi:myb-like protein K [Aplysia californica]|uniref:Myb-like protein K n=1 Tax=Aplysia californica TaxID=6500 RepID=A0ABM1AEQ9_APLCA|nr:myb-like protein K [Aplysia californica]
MRTLHLDETGSMRNIMGDSDYAAKQVFGDSHTQRFFSNQLSPEVQASSSASQNSGFQNLELPPQQGSYVKGKDNQASPERDTQTQTIDRFQQNEKEGSSPMERLDNLQSLREQLQRLQDIVEKLEHEQRDALQHQENRNDTTPKTDLPHPAAQTTNTNNNNTARQNTTNKDVGQSGGDYGNTAGVLKPQNVGEISSPQSKPALQTPVFIAGNKPPKDNSSSSPEYSNLLKTEVEGTEATPGSDVTRPSESPTPSTPKPESLLTHLTDNKIRIEMPEFNPDTVNDLAREEFNPLNPLYGVDLQQYLGRQTGKGEGFDPTKLNTQLAEQGLQTIGRK